MQHQAWQDACIKWLDAEPRSESDCYSLKALDYPNRALDQCTRESFEAALVGKTPATFNRYRAIIQAILHLSDHDIKIPLKKVTTAGFAS